MTTTTRNLDLESALNGAEQRFVSRNLKSQDRHEKAKASLPGGNTRTILHYPPFPVALGRGEGCFVCGTMTATAMPTLSASTRPASTATRTR